eukprot:TRINITY_DN10828_c0_g5_i1.p1 TRINITY_DN10828_c0_g5~~TRINITY_DN10828_c0_g5_i1.p1  ORF type:complete len:818 (-),score=103.93 TRINITY_DN10828_c0_g5_i1:292-2631(-)
MMNNPCTDHSSSQAQLPWCNPKLPIDERVKDMISRMTTQEKIQQLDTSAPAIPSLGLNAYNWWSEGTHGISHVKNDDKTPYESNFAFPITTAMSFNRTLWQKTGGQIGREARAFMNAGNAYSTYWAPVVNLAREPRWGRNIETPGEDPYLSGEYATAFVKGFERSPDDPTHIQASACCKHYAANSMEHSTVAGETWTRHNFDANISMQDLVDSYLLPFQACVEKGQVSSLMCSYNAINGVPSCANDWLLTDVARNSWGFDGYITSDCDADSDVFAEHHYTKTPEETVQKVLHAGTDVDCTSFVGQHAQRALDQGLITIADIDERLKYLFRVRMRLSHFDPEGPLNQIPTTEVCSDYAQALARDGVTQSAALLKNTGGTLPLNAAMLKSVAVIGPNSNLSKSVAGYYGGNSCNNKFYNMVDAVQQHVPATVTTLGVPSVSSDDIRGIHSAVAMAKSVDAVVLVIGTDLTLAHEEMDATGISLSKAQLRLVSEVADASSKPVVVVTLTALPVDISAILSNPKVGAVLHLGQPSVQTLGAGDVLFGLRSPAGKTIQTIYPASYADQVSIFDFNMRPGPSVWPRPDCAKGTKTSDCPRGTNPGRTHRFYTGKAVVPFGYGLSYTTFKYEVVKAPTRFSLRKLQQHLDDANSKGAWPNLVDLEALSDQAGYEVKVTNLGSIDADDVVLGFMKPPGAGTNGIPLQTLFGFTRVHVKAGQSETVWLYPSAMSFMHVELDGRKVALPGEYEVQFGLKETLVHGMGYASARLSAHMEDASADIQSFFT